MVGPTFLLGSPGKCLSQDDFASSGGCESENPTGRAAGDFRFTGPNRTGSME